MKFTVKQLFSIVDGRLSTSMDDVYTMLNLVTGESLMTHQLPTSMRFIQQTMPDWYIYAFANIKTAKDTVGDDFQKLMQWFDENPNEIEVSQLTETELSGFFDYMVENSLLKTIGSSL